MCGLLSIVLLAGCTLPASIHGSNTTKTPLVVFAAGSLIIPFRALETAFESKHPEIDIQAEYHGSIQVIRHATELQEPIDVIATADDYLIPMLMYNVNDPNSGLPYANWHIRFATNRLALAYQSQSRYAEQINSANWYSILDRPDIKVGIADPRFDPSGYRALMILELAGDYYNDPMIFMDMFTGQFSYPLGYYIDDDLTTITVPRIVTTSPDSRILIRGSSIQLIALLESGDLDYAFEYESVIAQHELEMVSFPDEINLGSAAIDYSSVVVELDYQRFASVTPTFTGGRIGYGITIPSNATHPEQAALFIAFLLGPEGRAIMQANHHPLFDPAVASQHENMPEILRTFCQPEMP